MPNAWKLRYKNTRGLPRAWSSSSGKHVKKDLNCRAPQIRTAQEKYWALRTSKDLDTTLIVINALTRSSKLSFKLNRLNPMNKGNREEWPNRMGHGRVRIRTCHLDV